MRFALTRTKQFDLVQAQTVAPAGRIEFQLHAVPAGTEIGGVTKPQALAVGADELAGEIQEVTLLPEIFQVCDHPPRPGDVVGLEDVGSASWPWWASRR